MTAAVGTATSDSPPELASTTYRRLQRMGFADPEAMNLTALRHGLGICRQPWSVRELTHLLFMRALRRSGQRWSDADDRRAELIGHIAIPAFPLPAPVPSSGIYPFESLPFMAAYLRTIRKEA
jgi:hypothetical protein